MRNLLPAFAAFVAMSGPAFAAPMSYDCDTGPGRFSELKEVQPGPAYRISGRISANELGTDKHWAPGANVMMESADAQSRATLKLVAPTRKAPLDVVLSITKGGETQTQTLGQVGLSQELAFVMIAAEDRVRVEIGTMRGEASIAVGTGASVSVVCSTGNFHFNDLRFGESE